MVTETWIKQASKTLPELHFDAVEASKWLRGATDAAVATVVELRQQASTIAQRWDLPPAQREVGLRLARAAAKDKIAGLDLERVAAEGRVRDYIARATSAQFDGGDPAAETQRGAAWARLKTQLDTLPQATVKTNVALDLLNGASQRGDRAMLEGARRELGAYLQLHNEELPPGMARDLDLLAGPQVAKDARDFEAALGFGPENTAVAIGTLRAHLDSPETHPAVVPAWDSEVINLEDDGSR